VQSIWADIIGSEVRFRGREFRTRTIEAGAGDPLILIHGVGGHAEAYSRNIKRLSEHFRVIAIDLIWHGYSSKHHPVDGNALIATYTKQVLDLMDSMDIKSAFIEGESLGGWITLWMALYHPDRLRKMVLNTNAGVRFNESEVKIDRVGGTNALRDRSLAAIRNPTRETIKKRLEWLMADPERVTEELIDIRHGIYSNPETQAALTEVFSKTFVEPRPETIDEDMLRKIRTPTLTLWADKNPGRGEDAGRRTANLIPGAEYYCIKDAGHWPQWEKPEEHDRVVIEFLKK